MLDLNKLTHAQIPNWTQDYGLPFLRSQILKLKGINHYEIPEVPIDHWIPFAIDDFMDELDALAMIQMITYNLGYSKEEANLHFLSPQTAPYKSHLQLSFNDTPELVSQLTLIGAYLNILYQQETDDINLKHQRQQRLVTYLEISFSYLFQNDENHLFDLVNGIVPDSRNLGKISPTPELSQLVMDICKRVARDHQIGSNELFTQVIDLTENLNFAIFHNVLQNHHLEPPLRQVLENTIEYQLDQPHLHRQKLQLLWMTHVFLDKMGIDTNTLYQLNGYPHPEALRSLLYGYLNDQDVVNEFTSHLLAETGIEYTDQKITYWHMLERLTSQNHQPPMPLTFLQQQDKLENVLKIASEHFPIGTEFSPLQQFVFPLKMGSTLRGLNISYKNSLGQTVVLTKVNPRDNRDKLGSTLLHEATHQAHAVIITAAETVTLLENGTWTRLTSLIKELMAQLLQGQAQYLFNSNLADNTNTHQGTLFSSLTHAHTMIHQAHISLIQLFVRQTFTNLIEHSDQLSWQLDDQTLDTILNQVNQIISAVQKLGIPIISNHTTPLAYLHPMRPFEGLVYIQPHLNPQDQSTNPSKEAFYNALQILNSAFQNRFTQLNWIANKDARAIFLYLLLQTGDNPDISSYPDIITNTDVEAAKQALQSIGIVDKLI